MDTIDPRFAPSVARRLSEIRLTAERQSPRSSAAGPPSVAEFATPSPGALWEKRDVHGRRCGIAAGDTAAVLSVDGEAFTKLARLADEIMGRLALGDIVSREFTEDFLFACRLGQERNDPVENPVLSLQDHVRGQVRERTYGFPLSGARGDRAFFFAGAEFLPKSADFEAVIERSIASAPPGQEQEAMRRQAEEWFPQYGNSMWASVTVNAEPRLAKRIATKTVNDATHLLRALCGNGYPPTRHVGLQPGSVLCESSFVVEKEPDGIGYSLGAASMPELLWFSDQFLDELTAMGLRNVEHLYRKESKTDLEELCLRALFVLGSVAGIRDLSDKIVYGCTSLDLLFTRGQDEPILATMPKRLALEIGANLDERKDIVRTVKQVYGLRSGRVHGGREADSSPEALRFFGYLFQLAGRLAFIAERHSTHKEYLDSLEERMLSG